VVPPSGSGDHRAGVHVWERDERQRERSVRREKIGFREKMK
jgi:hypothetical protein